MNHPPFRLILLSLLRFHRLSLPAAVSFGGSWMRFDACDVGRFRGRRTSLTPARHVVVLAVVWLVLLVMLPGRAAWAGNVVLGVTVTPMQLGSESVPGSGRAGVRIAVEHTGAPPFAITVHLRPWRLHLDFQNAVLANGAYSVAANPIVLDVRYGRLSVSSVRIVFGLITPIHVVRATTRGLNGGVRVLQIDLAIADPVSYAAMARQGTLIRGVSRPPSPLAVSAGPDIRIVDGEARAVLPAGTPVRFAAIPAAPYNSTGVKRSKPPVPIGVQGSESTKPPVPIGTKKNKPPEPRAKKKNRPSEPRAKKKQAEKKTSRSKRTIRITRRDVGDDSQRESALRWRDDAARLPLHRSGEAPLVIIDAGHGGVDPGAVGVTGLREKDLTLQVARKLARVLTETGGFLVRLTREGDQFIALRDRIALARSFLGRRNGTWSLFISLHADSIAQSSLHGASIYTLSERASDEEAAMLASRENEVDLIAGVDVPETSDVLTREILLDLAQGDTMDQARRLARQLADVSEGRIALLARPVRSAGFAVLKAPDIPSILFEMGFLSHRKDEQRLRSPEYRAKLIELIASAIVGHFSERAHAGRP